MLEMNKIPELTGNYFERRDDNPLEIANPTQDFRHGAANISSGTNITVLVVATHSQFHTNHCRCWRCNVVLTLFTEKNIFFFVSCDDNDVENKCHEPKNNNLIFCVHHHFFTTDDNRKKGRRSWTSDFFLFTLFRNACFFWASYWFTTSPTNVMKVKIQFIHRISARGSFMRKPNTKRHSRLHLNIYFFSVHKDQAAQPV